ncbi:Flp pilus assembly protein CpaB [Desulfovibrio aerotolerans]|uniref:Flp pilus assembly protein CpaB n=1 Tax=Solidesulfovibrio aerotolerans TaxID=295255 RepID=A0A7C9IWF6_9BACT|nr:Flp pilus assembly protein CpaB [Solidesulfovibrio aerotolerans]MYL83562.1 Flp pilus assembly protein CpaB [Solidesulfovibrio aerotolerans]
MKSKAIPHMILAVILALVAGVLTIRWLGSARAPQNEPTKATVARTEVLVASRAIPKGARLDSSMVQGKSFEADAVPQGVLRDGVEVYGRIAARDISADDPITPDKLMPKGTVSGGLDASVEAGKRAFTIKGTKIMGAGGLLTPGSRVDVLSTYTQPGKNDDKINKVILENVPVLATGTERETKIGKDGREELANTDFYTLMVTPEEAERLALASDLGSLHLALRKPGDADVVVTSGADVAKSLEAFAVAPAGPPVEPEPSLAEEANYSIETIRGTERERVRLDSLNTTPIKEENDHAKP